MCIRDSGTTELHDVSGYYLFDQLPTSVRTWNADTGTYEYALASYTCLLYTSRCV